MTQMFLNGTAMSGQKDHSCHAGSTFIRPTKTAPLYRFFAVRDEFPGLLPVDEGGRPITGELYDIPDDVLRDSLLPAEPEELTLGEVTLENNEVVRAMILVPSRLHAGDQVVDIADLGGFRAYQAFLQANRRLGAVLGRGDLDIIKSVGIHASGAPTRLKG